MADLALLSTSRSKRNREDEEDNPSSGSSERGSQRKQRPTRVSSSSSSFLNFDVLGDIASFFRPFSKECGRCCLVNYNFYCAFANEDFWREQLFLYGYTTKRLAELFPKEEAEDDTSTATAEGAAVVERPREKSGEIQEGAGSGPLLCTGRCFSFRGLVLKDLKLSRFRFNNLQDYYAASAKDPVVQKKRVLINLSTASVAQLQKLKSPCPVAYIRVSTATGKSTEEVALSNSSPSSSSGLAELKDIPNIFYSVSIQTMSKHDFPHLVSVDLSGMRGILRIKIFLKGCFTLQSATLRNLTSLETIDAYFLHDCRNLVTLDMTGAKNLKKIGNNFLSESKSLTEFDFGALSTVTTVGDYFFSCCHAFPEADLSPMASLQTIGRSAFFGCSNLKSILIQDLIHLDTIGASFAQGCTSLEKCAILGSNSSVDHEEESNIVELPPPLALRIIASSFLRSCHNLKSFEMSRTDLLLSLSECFMADCKSVEKVHLQDLKSLKTISYQVFAGCQNMKELKLEGLTSSLTKMEGFFCDSCSSLRVLKMEGACGLDNHGGNLLRNCKGLEEVSVTGGSPVFRKLISSIVTTKH